jgi:hypothetical protein
LPLTLERAYWYRPDFIVAAQTPLQFTAFPNETFVRLSAAWWYWCTPEGAIALA